MKSKKRSISDKKRGMFILLSVAILSFLLVESMSNLTLQVTAVVFWQFKKSRFIWGWILIYSLIVFGIPFIFSQFPISPTRKLSALTRLIIVSRVMALFYISGEWMLLFVTLLVVSLLTYFAQLLTICGTSEYFCSIRDVIAGFIVGSGINYAVLSIDYTSNLTYGRIKFPIVLGFSVMLAYFGARLFKEKKHDETLEASYYRKETKAVKTKQTAKVNVEKTEKTAEKTKRKKPLRFAHFVFLGLASFLTIGWIVNPAGISAYDKSFLGRPSHGFLVYGALGLVFGVAAFYMVSIFLSKLKNGVKRLLFSANVAFLIFNGSAVFVIESGSPSIGALFLIVMLFVGFFTLILDVWYLFARYSFSSSKIITGGQILVFFTFGLCYGLTIFLTQILYDSLLYSIAILSALFVLFFLIGEFKSLNVKFSRVSFQSSTSREYGAIFLCIFLLNIGCTYSTHGPLKSGELVSGDPTIMVWNVHNGIGLDYKFDLDRIARQIRELDPDVLGLNELDKGLFKAGLIDVGLYLAEKLNMYYFYAPTYYEHYGIAILSKNPFEHVENVPLPRSPEVNGEPRTLIRAKIAINDELWSFYVNHLSTEKEDRVLQVPFIVDLIEQEEFKNVVWMGDFNAKPHEEPYELINSSGGINFRDTHRYLDPDPGLTGSLDGNADPSKRIDYIFCSPELVPLNAKVHCSIASDHCAVITQFKGSPSIT